MSSGTPKQAKNVHVRVAAPNKSEKLKLLTSELKTSKSSTANYPSYQEQRQRVRVSTKISHETNMSSKKETAKPSIGTLESLYGAKKSAAPLSPRDWSRGRPATGLQDFSQINNTESSRRDVGTSGNYRVGHLRSGLRSFPDAPGKRSHSLAGSQKYGQHSTWQTRLGTAPDIDPNDASGLKKPATAYIEPMLAGYGRFTESVQERTKPVEPPRPATGLVETSSSISAKGRNSFSAQTRSRTTTSSLTVVQLGQLHEVREKERQTIASQFCSEYRSIVTSVTHLDSHQGYHNRIRLSADALLARSPYRTHLEKLTTLEFKMNEFVPIHVSEKYNRSFPLVVLQIDGVFGCSYTNLNLGTELVLTKKFSCSEFTQRQACIVDTDLANTIKQISEYANVVLVFQKSHSKAKELAIYLGQTLKNDIVGIFTRKQMNKSSKFVSYNKILSHFAEVIPKQVYIIAPFKGDMKYWSSAEFHPKAKQDGVKQCRYLTVNDVQDSFDIVLPLINPSSKFQFRIGLVEDFISREFDLIKKATAEPLDESSLFFEVGPVEKPLHEKIEFFIKNKASPTSIPLVPNKFSEYLEFFHLVTHRNYLKYIRKKDDELSEALQPGSEGGAIQGMDIGGVGTYPDNYSMDKVKMLHPQLHQSNLQSWLGMSERTSTPVHTSPQFLANLHEYSYAVTLKNTELSSIVGLCSSIEIL